MATSQSSSQSSSKSSRKSPSTPRSKPRPSGFPAPKRIPRRPGGPKPPGSTRQRLVELTLRSAHTINGRPYGPGTVSVTEGLAAMLREQEQRVQEAEARFRGQRAVIVGPGLRLHEVAYDALDNPAGFSSAFPEIGSATTQGRFTPNF